MTTVPSKYFEKTVLPPFNDSDFSIAKAYWFAELARLSYRSYRRVSFILNRKFNIINVTYFDNNGTQAFGFTWKNNVYVVFRGTEITSWEDIRSDISVWMVEEEHGRVHHGFKEAVDSVWDDIVQFLSKHRDKTLWWCGHSLGGACAVISANRVPNSVVYTYGCPRVGNYEYAMNYQVPHWRFVNCNDIVPKVPKLGYMHTGKLIYLNYKGQISNYTWWQRIIDGIKGFWRALCKFQLFSWLVDHNILRYSKKLKRYL